jgi:hypothetical protein
MSHQFSFLQLFAGYKFLQCKLLSISTQNIRSKSLRADLGVECHRRVEILLQRGIRKFQTHISRRFIFFQQMCFCWNISAILTIICKYCHLSIGRFEHFNHQYIQWLKKLLRHFPSYEVDSYIFDASQIVLLCKYLSQLGFLNKQQCIC